MPTGYTYKLEENGFDVKRWLIEDVSRAFGMCIMLRDERSGMSQEEIEASITSSSTYHQDAIGSAKAIIERPSDEWSTLFIKEKAEKSKEYLEKCIETAEKRIKYKTALMALQDLQRGPLDKEVSANVVTFAIDQLNMVGSEYEKPDAKWYTIEEETWEEYRDSCVSKAHKDIAYHMKSMREDKERDDGRVDAYRTFVKDIEAHFG